MEEIEKIRALIMIPITKERIEKFNYINEKSVEIKGSRKEEIEETEIIYEFIYQENPSIEELEQAEVIIGTPSWKQLSKTKNLKWLQITCAGADYYLKKKEWLQDIILTNVTGAFGQCISEYILAMIVSFYKKMHLYRDNQRMHKWENRGTVDTLFEKTVLIIGAGDIGTETAKLTKMFQCYNIGIRRIPREKPSCFDEMYTLKNLEELLPKADIVILSLPKTEQTNHILNEKMIKKMKTSAFLINVGRGNAVDSQALAQALKSNVIAGAAMDVLEEEPLSETHPLWECENAIITPHITGISFGDLKQTEEIVIQICLENLEKYKQKQILRNRISLETGYRML